MKTNNEKEAIYWLLSVIENLTYDNLATAKKHLKTATKYMDKIEEADEV